MFTFSRPGWTAFSLRVTNFSTALSACSSLSLTRSEISSSSESSVDCRSGTILYRAFRASKADWAACKLQAQQQSLSICEGNNKLHQNWNKLTTILQLLHEYASSGMLAASSISSQIQDNAFRSSHVTALWMGAGNTGPTLAGISHLERHKQMLWRIYSLVASACIHPSAR